MMSKPGGVSDVDEVWSPVILCSLLNYAETHSESTTSQHGYHTTATPPTNINWGGDDGHVTLMGEEFSVQLPVDMCKQKYEDMIRGEVERAAVSEASQSPHDLLTQRTTSLAHSHINAQRDRLANMLRYFQDKLSTLSDRGEPLSELNVLLDRPAADDGTATIAELESLMSMIESSPAAGAVCGAVGGGSGGHEGVDVATAPLLTSSTSQSTSQYTSHPPPLSTDNTTTAAGGSGKKLRSATTVTPKKQQQQQTRVMRKRGRKGGAGGSQVSTDDVMMTSYSDDAHSEADSSSIQLPGAGSDSTRPATPASLVSEDREREAEYQRWKKSIMVLFKAIAGYKSAGIFTNPVTDSQAPGYSAVVYRPIDLKCIQKQ